jgi:hypothetical protein
MHCPYCRETNAPTTRFCTSCGAVLVEEAPGGGRRRVLRPWGLRKSAPLTISPDLPLLAAPLPSAPVPSPGGVRVDVWFAAGIAALMALAAAVYPVVAPPAATSAMEPVTTTRASMAVPAPARVREAWLAAPPLVEAQSTDAQRLPATSATASHVAPRKAAARPAVAVPTAQPAAPREAVMVAEARVPEPVLQVAAVAPATAPDRWQSLRSELAGCRSLGLLQKAVCEQGARVSHCPGLWGHHDLCPAGRADTP